MLFALLKSWNFMTYLKIDFLLPAAIIRQILLNLNLRIAICERILLQQKEMFSIDLTFGAKTTSWVTVVPINRQPDVTPYNITSCSTSKRDKVSPTALKMTTLYKHNPICLESFKAAIVTWNRNHIIWLTFIIEHTARNPFGNLAHDYC